jgi:PTH1 family peptidyl-tRNA hydrolase
MNLSGDSIHEILHFYKEPPENLVVIYDDVDLPVGKLRIRPKGSAGTHNGMRSILARIGSENFPRVRIGIGRPPAGWDLADFVLSRFSIAEREAVNEVIERSSTAVSAILCAGPEAAMCRYNG